MRTRLSVHGHKHTHHQHTSPAPNNPPQKNRYKHLIGQSVVVPMSTGRTVPVIADTYVDMAFGTGALKITPGKEIKNIIILFYCKCLLSGCMLWISKLYTGPSIARPGGGSRN